MSNYYFNNQPISTFLRYSPYSYSYIQSNYYENGTTLPCLQVYPDDTLKITNTSFNYFKGGIDIATLFEPPYIEFDTTGTYTYNNIPIWCKVCRCIIIAGGGSGYSQYTNGGGGGQFSYSDINIIKTTPRVLTIVVGDGGSSGGSNGGNSSISYGGYSSVANGGLCATLNPGAGGSGNIYSASLSYDGQAGQAGTTPGYIYGGNNGLKYAGIKHEDIQYLAYGKGGDGGNTADEFSGYYSGNSGYVRIYFCVN